MTKDEARQCTERLRERWTDDQLRIVPIGEDWYDDDDHALRLVLPQGGQSLTMRHARQLSAAMDKIAGVLDRGASAQRKPEERQEKPAAHTSSMATARPVPATRAVPRQLEASAPGRWEHGDECEITGRHDGPFTVLAQVDRQTLLCEKMNGQLFHGRAQLARRITKGARG